MKSAQWMVPVVAALVVLSGCVARRSPPMGSAPAVITSTPALIVVQEAPPGPRTEIIGVAPSTQHVWAPGYYEWNGKRYVWKPGDWVKRPRTGATWVEGHWEKRPAGWTWVPGHWK